MDTQERAKPSFDPSRPIASSGKAVGIGVAILAAVVLIYGARYTDGTAVWGAVSRIPLWILVIMVAIQLFHISQQAYVYKRLYAAVGYGRSLLYCVQLYLAMNLVNTVAPVAGLSGSVYMVYVERQNGVPRTDSVVINLFYYLMDYAIFLLLLVASLAYLSYAASLSSAVTGTVLLLLAILVGLCMAGAFLFVRPTLLSQFLSRGARVLAWLKIPVSGRFSPERLVDFIDRVKGSWLKVASQRNVLTKIALHCCLFHACSVAVLLLAFSAVGVQAHVPMVAAGYAVGMLLTIVSVTPNGIGIAEGGMTAVLAALGVPVAQALVIVLLYRAITNWLTLLGGVPALHAVSARAGRAAIRSSTMPV